MRRDDDPLSDTALASDESVTPVVRVRGPAIPAGTKVGRYVITEQLGSGGMGTVYAAKDPELGRRVAIKLLHPHLKEMQARLLREGQAIARLRHPNVVTIYDVGTYDDNLFIAMELVAGTTLRRWLESPHTWQQICATFVAAGRGLAAAHAAGLVHRDFKPDNVLLGDDGSIVVTDFGLARTVDDDAVERSAGEGAAKLVDVTQSGAFVGTPAYMSPEQFRGQAIDARSDQFSFCVALYEALYRVRPFAGETIAELQAAVLAGAVPPPPADTQVPAYLQAAIERGLEPDPSKRHASMEALLRELAPRRRARWPLFAAAGAVLASSGVIAYVTTREAAAPPERCATSDAAIRGAWTGTDRSRANALDVATFDTFVDHWRGQRRVACLLDKEPHKRVAACLDRIAGEFRELVAQRLPDDPHWPALPSLTRCLKGDATAPLVKPVVKPAPELALLSPDGTQFASLADGKLTISSIETSLAIKDFTLPEAAFVSHWNQPGSLVVVDRTVSKALGVELTRGTVGESPLPRNAQLIAPDMQNALVVEAGDVYLESMVTPNQRRLLGRLEPNRHPIALAWSPSSERLAIILGPGSDPELHIFEVRSGTVHRLPMRARPSNDLLWLDEGRLVFVSDGVWSLLLSNGKLVEPPERRLPALPAGQRYNLVATNGKRVLAKIVTSTHELVRLHRGKPEVVPVATDLRRVKGITSDAKHIAVECADDVGSLSLVDHKYTRHGGRDDVIAVDGKRMLLVQGNALFELGEQGKRKITELPASTSRRLIACRHAGGVCMIVSWGGGTPELRMLRGDSLGSPQRTLIDYRIRDIAVDPTGEKLAVAGAQPNVVEIKQLLSSTYDRVSLPTDAPCGPTSHVAWKADGTLFASQPCAPRSRLLEVGKRGTKAIFDDRGSINGFAATPSGDVYVNVSHDSAELVVIDGL